VPLVAQRHGAVLAALRSCGARRVVDLGCGSGALLPTLLAEAALTEVVGVDVSHRALQEAARRLRLDRMPERKRDRLQLLQGALTYTDKRLVGYDAAVLMEVIEHLDPDRLPALEHAVFGFARPLHVIVTTPNVEHNVRFPDLPAGRDAAPRPPLRVDPRRVRRLDAPGRRRARLRRPSAGRRHRRRRGRAADPDGRLHPHSGTRSADLSEDGAA
jgi:SAM-dependent methyltransferase